MLCYSKRSHAELEEQLMSSVRNTALAFLILLVFAAACSDDDPTPATDADVSASDVAEDADSDPVPDTGPDTLIDRADRADIQDEPDVPQPVDYPIDDLGPITDLHIDGLSDDVEIKFDEYGIPSILCENDDDCAIVLGYLHARDRFFQMDVRRRLVRGRLSQIVTVGEAVLGVDLANRALFSTANGQPIEDFVLEHASEDTLASLAAYSLGVNGWLDDLKNGRNGASLPQEYSFGLLHMTSIPPWTPADSVASVAAIIESLTNSGEIDLALGEVLAAIEADPDMDASVFSDYFRPLPFSDSTVIDDYEYPADQEKSGVNSRRTLRMADYLPVLRDARSRLSGTGVLGGPASDRGSNNWVISEDLTEAGVPLLANDPHLGLSNPSVWYPAHIDAVTNGSGEVHAAGLTFAGIPWVLIGQNENIAFGNTNTAFDFSDVYLEQLTEDGNGVVFEGDDVPFVEVEFEFPQPLGTTETRTALYVPHHGPVLAIDEEAGTAVSLRWTGNNISTDVNYLTELNRAANLDEARDALRNITTVGQNIVVVDTAGDIGWFPYNTVPIRPWSSLEHPGYLPLDGTGGEEWDGFIAYDDLPQAVNPDEGYLATANNDMTGANLDGDPTNDGHPLLQSYPSSGIRQQRIIDLLEATDEHTSDTMLEIVGDTFSIVGETLSPALLAVDRDELTTDGQALYDAIDAWEFDCPTGLATSDPSGAASDDSEQLAEALGCAAFHRVLSSAYGGWCGDEVEAYEWAESPWAMSFFRALVRPDELTNPDLLWDDVSTDDETETQADVLAAAFDAGAALFEGQVGDEPSDWLWGRVHASTFAADLFSSFGVPTFDDGPFAKDGGLYTVNVANIGLGGDKLNPRSGASTRLICEAPESGVTCNIQLPGGLPHFRQDANYLGLVERWLRNEPVPLVFDHAALDTPAITASPAE